MNESHIKKKLQVQYTRTILPAIIMAERRIINKARTDDDTHILLCQ